MTLLTTIKNLASLKRADLITTVKLPLMLMITFLLSLCCAWLLAGCAVNNKVLVATGTVLGMEVAQNPATQLYNAKLGYGRSEVALVPVDATGKYTPDVLVELNMSGLLSFNASVYQRLAVGPEAVSQIGAAALFSKDAQGSVNTNALEAYKTLKLAPTQPLPASPFK